MADDAWSQDGAGIGVTIKTGKGYEDTWITFRGSPKQIREDICATFGMECANVADLSLFDVVVNATTIAHGTSTVASKLGGTVVSNKAKAEEPKEEQPAEPEANPILAQIEACADTDALRRLWAENQAAFSDAAVMAAWKAKGKALKAAG